MKTKLLIMAFLLSTFGVTSGNVVHLDGASTPEALRKDFIDANGDGRTEYTP
jgi:hypothetical protein